MRLVFWTLLFLVGCTNYSSRPQFANPPIILAVQTEGSGHLLQVSAQNYEIGFAGYQLYEADTEDAVLRLDPLGSGLSCGSLAALPNQSSPAYIEVKPDQIDVTPGTTDRLCAIQHQLVSGKWILLRSLVFKDIFSFSPSIPSNTFVVP